MRIFPTAQRDLRLVVIDDFSRASEAPRAQSWWQWLVYGPDVAPRTVALRNPQGVCNKGGGTLVADQGFPGVFFFKTPGGSPQPATTEPPACPVDVAVDADGRIFVADTTRRAVLQYSAEGRLERSITPGHGEPFRPASVLCFGSVLYVGDTAGHRVLRLDLEKDVWLEPLGSQLAGTPPIAPAGLARTTSGELVILDAVTGLVRIWNEQTGAVRELGHTGRGPCEFVRPLHAATAGDLIVITDAAKQTVIVLDSAGECLAELGAGAGQTPRFTLPSGITKVPHEWRTMLDSAAAQAIEGAVGCIAGTPNCCAMTDWLVVTDALGEMPLRWLGVARDCPAP